MENGISFSRGDVPRVFWPILYFVIRCHVLHAKTSAFGVWRKKKKSFISHDSPLLRFSAICCGRHQKGAAILASVPDGRIVFSILSKRILLPDCESHTGRKNKQIKSKREREPFSYRPHASCRINNFSSHACPSRIPNLERFKQFLDRCLFRKKKKKRKVTNLPRRITSSRCNFLTKSLKALLSQAISRWGVCSYVHC